MKIYLLLMVLSTASLSVFSQKYDYNFLIGTFTNNTASEGIYSLNIDVEKSLVSVKTYAKNITNPSFLALTPDKKFVYSVNESGEKSKVSALNFNTENESMQLINAVNAGGPGPCFIATSEKHVITGNYTGGSLAIFKRMTNGSLSELVQLIQHKGSSINTSRQTSSHVHQTIFSPDNKYLLVNDLGTDLVTVYKYDANSETNVLTLFDTLKVKLGSGPRHLAFNKKGNLIYLLQELDGTLSVLSFKNGKLRIVQESTVVYKTGIKTGAADIHISPDGKFVYATNRGTANDISCFKIEKNGTVSFVQQVSTKGDGPRNFAITADGKYILVANQRTNNIVVFKRNYKTGELIDTDLNINVPSPVCLIEY